MSDLQLSLLALGAVIIAAVILFNWWQERRFMQETQQRFEGPSDDALMEDFHIDPEAVAVFDPEPITEQHFDEPEIREDALLEELRPPRQAEEPAPRRAPAPAAPEPEFFIPRETARPAIDPQPELPQPDDIPWQEPPPLRSERHMQPAEQPQPQPQPEVQPQPSVVQPPKEEPPAATLVSSMPQEVDELVDLIAKGVLPGNLDIPALLQAIAQMPKFDKPTRWFVQDETGFWRALTPELSSGYYPQFACALQLADRAGPVSQGTLRAFREQVTNLASILGANPEWHGPADPQQYAKELDQFCIEVDVMVGFHIMQGEGGSFAGTKLRALAEAGGMRLHEDGAFHFENAAGHTLFTLMSQDGRPFKPETLRTVFYRAVTLQLDVPKVESSDATFLQMVAFAHQLEAGLEGILVDDNQRPLGENEIEKIRQQLKTIHSKMVARFILPGTPTALRLFS